jgi:hypothetical protein
MKTKTTLSKIYFSAVIALLAVMVGCATNDQQLDELL